MSIQKTRILGMFVAALVALLTVAAPGAAQSAFDDYGYNNDAMIFIGTGDSWDRSLDGTYAGDPTYANDRLTMRWNAEWVRGVQEEWADPAGYDGAWLSSQWNGNVPGGSGELAAYKFVWAGACVEGEPLDSGGSCVQEPFAVILDPGSDSDSQFLAMHANQAGYGMTVADASPEQG